MKKIQFGLTEEQMLITKGWTVVPSDSNDPTQPVLFIPPLESDERPFIKMSDGTRINVTANMCDAIYRYVDRESAADDLNYFTNDKYEGGEFVEHKDEIEECKEDIIDNYIERRNGAESWWDDMRDSIKYSLGLY